MEAVEEHLQALRERIPASCLGVLPWAPGAGARELAKKIGGMRPEGTMLVKAACNSIYNMDYRTAWRYADACSAVLEAAPKDDTGGK